MAPEEVKKIFEEKCRKGLHPFEEISRYGFGFASEENVVRWCPICGTITVDMDVDNRTAPGAIIKARRPKILERS